MKQYGLNLQPIEDGIHYVLGTLDPLAEYPILMPDGHGWGEYLPVPEVQYNGALETFNCTNYGTNNCLETLAKFKGYEAFPKDCSERYTGVMTGTTKQGNDPHSVIQIIRNISGEIPEISLPFNKDITTWEEYYSPNPMGANQIFGKALLKKFKIQHRWVFNTQAWSTDKTDKLKHALQYSPIGISVYAWQMGPIEDYYVMPPGAGNNHWVMLYDYVDSEYWLIYDSYDQTIKKLAWDFNFFAAKNYYIDQIPFTTPKNWWDRLWDLFRINGLLGKKSV